MNPKQPTNESKKRTNERKTKKKRNWIVNRSSDNRMIGANNNTCTHQLHLLRFLTLCTFAFSRAQFPLLSFIGCACVALIYILQSNHWYRTRVLALANASMAFSAILNCFILRIYAPQVNGLFRSLFRFLNSIWFWFIYLIFFAHDTFFPQFVCGRTRYQASLQPTN